MMDGYTALSEKEKETLRLIVRGHDAKSMARHLGLSVHTINERLRDARRKLSVSSSREAARLLHEREGTDPETLADKQIGEAAQHQGVEQDGGPANGPRQAHRPARMVRGIAIMLLATGLLALAALSQPAPDPRAAAAPAAETAVVASARSWLALVDQNRWQESWAATGASFRQLNTVQVWTSVSEKMRAQLGALRSRDLISQEDVPAPPAGVTVVKFRTSYANKPTATDTLSLAPEDGGWRVVGYYIE